MSLRVMTWAWAIQLAPNAKLVPMALADEADDSGFCFPGHRRIAMKCSISERTVRRMLGELEAAGHLSVEARYRRDRSQSSNGYRLACAHPPDKMSRGVDMHVQGPRPSVTREVDMRVLRTTNYPLSNPPPPRDATQSRDESARDLPGCDGGGGRDLEFPMALSPKQIEAVNRLLTEIDDASAQQLLDELAGRMKTARITNPIRYCAALLARLKAREFTPELGIRVAEERAARVQRQRRESAPARAGSADVNTAVSGLPNDVQAALERMRKRAQQTPTQVTPPDES